MAIWGKNITASFHLRCILWVKAITREVEGFRNPEEDSENCFWFSISLSQWDTALFDSETEGKEGRGKTDKDDVSEEGRCQTGVCNKTTRPGGKRKPEESSLHFMSGSELCQFVGEGRRARGSVGSWDRERDNIWLAHLLMVVNWVPSAFL